MISQRGQSLTMWVVVMGVVIASLMMFMVPTKRALTKKVLRLNDKMAWRIWGEVETEDGGADSNQIGNSTYTTTMDNTIQRVEQQGKTAIVTNQDMTAQTASYYKGYQ